MADKEQPDGLKGVPTGDAYLKALMSFEKLTDAQLCEQVVHKVWTNLKVGSEAECLFSELLDRFEKRAGIERDAEGRIISEPKPTATLQNDHGNKEV